MHNNGSATFKDYPSGGVGNLSGHWCSNGGFLRYAPGLVIAALTPPGSTGFNLRTNAQEAEPSGPGAAGNAGLCATLSCTATQYSNGSDKHRP